MRKFPLKKITAMILSLATVALTASLASCQTGGKTPAAGVLENGAIYKIKEASSSLAMSTANFAKQNDATVKVELYDRDLNQMWRALAKEDGSYDFVNMSSLQTLTVRKGSSRDGARLSVTEEGTADATKGWILSAANEGSYNIKNAKNEMYIGIKSTDEGTGVEQYAEKGETGFEWIFDKVSDGAGEYPRVLVLTGDIVSSASTPEIIKADGVYYNVNMTGGIILKTSTDLLSWKKIGAIFNPKPSWMSGDIPSSIWAPGIYRLGDMFCLYYCVSSSGSQNSAIGLAVNKTLDLTSPDYKWEDKGIVIRSSPGDLYNAIDPNLFVDDDGQAWMFFGSYWQGIFAKKIDSATGLAAADKTSYNLAKASKGGFEAPYVIKRGDYYYLFVAHGPMADGYSLMVGRSENLLGPYVDKNGTDMMAGGGTQLTEYKEGIEAVGHCQIFLDDDGTYYLVAESWENRGTTDQSSVILNISTVVWSPDGWPVTAYDKNVLNSLGE